MPRKSKAPKGAKADETERSALQAEPERLHHRCIAVRNRRTAQPVADAPQKQSCLTHRFCYRAAFRLSRKCSAWSRKTYPERSGGTVPLSENGARGKGGSPFASAHRDPGEP